MKLHIVIPVLNCIDLTKQAVESFVSKVDYSIHIIDQASTDGTKQWAEANQNNNFWYHGYYPRVSVSEAWNRGMQESIRDPECQYILVTNNDVIYHKTTINNLIDSMDRLNLAMVTAENIAPKMSVAAMNVQNEWGDIEFDNQPITSWMQEGPDFSCFMLKRDFPETYGWFDENYYPAYVEDQDAHIRIRKTGGHAKRMTKAPYYHIASQTIAKNQQITAETHAGHNSNKGYYQKKWGASHGEMLKGKGFNTPFNDPLKPIWWWKGCEKYDNPK